MNLPNKITLFRVFLIPFFIICLLFNTKESIIAATIIFTLASLTDFLDGYLARKHNLITNFGKFMDPLADKLLTLSAFIIFIKFDLIHPVIVFIIVSRELIISIFRAIAVDQNIVLAASKLAKMKTVSQMVVILFLLIIMIINNEVLYYISIFLIYLMLFLTITSLIEYLVKNKQVVNEIK